MRTLLQLATIALLTGATAAHAQVYNPDNLIGKPPTPPRHEQVQPTDDLQWMWQYTRPAPGGMASNLRRDARFLALLQNNFKQPQSMWGPENSHEPLPIVIPLFLSQYGVVNAEDNRYISIDGCVPGFCASAGMLWVDLGRKQPLAVFAATNWTNEGHDTNDPKADFNLWLFPNRNLSPDALPFAFTEAIAHWNARLAASHRLVPHIAHAIIVEPDGQPAAVNPALAGANTLAPQPDTLTPAAPEEN
jgi:hypothetical protein